MTVPPFYSVEVITPSGETVDTIDNPISLVAARSYTAVGSAVLTVLPDYTEEFFRYNMRFKLWRTDTSYGKSLFGDTIWFLRKFTHNVSQRNYAIELADALTLLNNPVVAYTAQTPYADKTLEELGDITYDDYYRIDNLMKEYVRENFGSNALDAARINPLIAVEPNLNLAPYGEKTASWAKLSNVLSDLARMSAEKGMELFYDLIPQFDDTFIFRVWRDIRGVDRGFASAASLIFSDENGDLDDVQVVYDYSAMATYCYVLGYDTGPSQVIVEIGNSAIIESDPFGRIEFTANSTDNDVTSVLLADGQAALFALRPRRILSAKLSPASSLRYGTDFAYGDRVGVQVGGRLYDCQISAVRAEWREAIERLDIRLDGSESLWNPTYWEDDTAVPIITPPANYEVPVQPDPGPYTPPAFGDPSLFSGDIQAYVMWGNDLIFRTWNLLDASPKWHLINNGVTGSVWDCQYVNVDADTIGAWLMTSTGIWWCDDIQAGVVVWTKVLSIETVIATEVAPVEGTTTFQTMFHAWSYPGHLCVATTPTVDAVDLNYMHAYFWITEDYGQTWATVDMDAFTETYPGGYEGAYCHSSLYAMNVSRNTQDVWCVRSAIVGLNRIARVFHSNDLGYTWEIGVEVTNALNNFRDFSLLNPFPNLTDPSYVTSGQIGASQRLYLQRSTDGWATKTDIAYYDGSVSVPPGYFGVSPLFRVNKRTFNNDHIICWMHQGSNVWHLMQTFDGAANWANYYTTDNGSVTNTPNGEYGTARYNTPNGWPPDVDQWVMIRPTISGVGPVDVVLLTEDNFTTVVAKDGDLSVLTSTWLNRASDGFALPKIGTNATVPDSDSHVRVRTSAVTAAITASPASIPSTGVMEGDTVLLHLRTLEDFAPLTVPEGFTLVTDAEITGTNSIRIYQKIAGSSEPANYTFTYTSGTVQIGLVALYPDGGGTVTLDGSANLSAAIASGVAFAPSVDTTVPFTLLTCFFSLPGSSNCVAQEHMVKQYDTVSGGIHATSQETWSGVGESGQRQIGSVGLTGIVKAITLAWKRVL